ncbi:beta-defensin 1-like [Microcebus murinus]|uniref:beta-defensin 1-like n=1 Tax=Microcebus murinus TaxID=30608 RepID=UPI00085B47CA|nr:beta-defensin 1-like [Microcebus murinus]
MRILHLLFTGLLVFLLPLPGFSKDITNPISCARNRGVCIPFSCTKTWKQIGTCGPSRIKCCRKK